MSTGIRERAEAIFLLVAALPRDRWNEDLAGRCAGDAALEREVRSLLECHDGAEGFLDAAELGHARPAPPPDEELAAGTRIGEYVVQRLLGKGGMGNVYVAEQDRPRRTVALKVIRRGIGTSGLQRRFEHEAEILGRLHHPGIAQVYEAGASPAAGGGAGLQPYIAMELIHGLPLNSYAAEKGLPTPERLELMAKVCDAVHHAHQRGVIHRDLKPANILVDEHGQPKVLDFGVARAADADLRVTTLRTSVGQLIGTLPYMSPEQVLGDPAEVDTRSDVYALGVLLYQVLTGRLPLDVSSRSLVEAARVVRDELPTRIGRMDRAFRGDIETIVAGALEKDKARRYQSAADLGADLRRAVAGEPILAKQDSALYVLRTQFRRHRVPVLGALAIFVAIVAFAVYASVAARTERRLASAATNALTAARREAERASEAGARLSAELARSNIERGRLLGLSGSLAAAEDLIWPAHVRNPGSRLTLFALWELYAHHRCEGAIPIPLPLDPPSRSTAALRTRMQLSADGSLIVACAEVPTAAVWDTATMDRVATVGRGDAPITGLAFSRGGPLATGDARGRILLWDARSGAELGMVRTGGVAPTDLAFDRTGAVLGAVLRNGSIALFDTQAVASGDSEPKRLLAQRPGLNARTISFSPAADLVALGRADEILTIARVPGLETIYDLTTPDDHPPQIAWSPDGSLVAGGGGGRIVRLWNAASGSIAGTLRASNGLVGGVAFTPDGRGLLASGWWRVNHWDLATQQIVRSFSGFTSTATDVAVSPDGRRVWTNLTSMIRAWELGPDAGLTRITAPTTRTLIVFSPTGEMIAGEADGAVNLLKDPTGELVATLGTGPRRIRSIAVSPIAPIAATTSVVGLLSLWDLERRALITEWGGFKMTTNDGMRFDSTGTRLVTPAAGDTFKVIEVPSGREVLAIRSDGAEALCAAFSPDDRIIATTTRHRTVHLYDAATGALLRHCERPLGSPWTVVFSPDGQKVLAGNWARSIDIWDVATGRLDRSLTGHQGLVTDVSFHPREPSLLASCGADGQVMLWDLSDPHNTPILTLRGFDDGWEVWSLDFDRSGSRLTATSGLGTTLIWDLHHFDRHIGGNMRTWIEQHPDLLPEGFDEAAAMEQRKSLLTRGPPRP